MVRIKTPGIITFSEYNQAKIASQFTIAKAIVCCYCQEPVEVEQCGSENLMECEQHGTMRLEVSDEDMTFYLHRLNGRLLGEDSVSLANKGCPFCDSTLEAGITHIYETRPDNQVLGYPLDCSMCEISFYVVVSHQGELRFQPKPDHFQPDFQNDIETASPRVEVSEPTLTDNALPAIDVFDNNAETTPSQVAAPSKGKNVRKQILRVLHASGTPLRRSEIQAQVDGNVVKPLRKLVNDGLVIQPKRGYYSLP